MKKIILIVLTIVLFAISLTAQSKIDPPALFNSNTESVIKKESTNFLRGWNWGSSGRKLDEALLINSYHSLPHKIENELDRTGYISTIGDSIKLIEWLGIPGIRWDDWRNLTGRNDTLAFNGMSLHLNPTVTIDPTSEYKSRWNDSSGAVFGFRYKNWAVGDTISTGIDQHRFILSRNKLSTDSAIVLNNIWDGKILRYQDYDRTKYDTRLKQYSLYFGEIICDNCNLLLV